MEQSFLLKYYGGYDIYEQAMMTAEDRNWIIKRINDENKKQEEQSRVNTPKGYSGSQFR
jgi:hypothetical protein